jgi:hypothetical protein
MHKGKQTMVKMPIIKKGVILEETRKLCPLFENILPPEDDNFKIGIVHGINLANAALPQDAIKYALKCLRTVRDIDKDTLRYFEKGTPEYNVYVKRLDDVDKHKRQLRALLTGDHSDR